MTDDLVRISRAGDAFHYRWAARRSLRLVYPNSPLSKLVIEGSDEKNKAGEYVIDVSEYYGPESAPVQIIYYQLKHTTNQKNKPFLISGLEDTFTGFADRFKQHHKKKQIAKLGISFSIITNRPFDQKFKDNLQKIANGTCTDNRFINIITKYTKLNPADLKLFCSILQIEDAHSDYDLQQQELRAEMMRLRPGIVDNNLLRSLSGVIAEKVLPNSKGTVRREDVLSSFGIYSDRDLYPAAPAWEPADQVIKRQQHQQLSDAIMAASQPIIVHAAGGIGKSVFTRQLLDNIQTGSVAIAYDCFGAGKYRNRSQSRHRHKEALVQIANELAAKGLCDPMLVNNNDDESSIIRSFLNKITIAISTIREDYPDAILLILIDAADNAQMAAKEMNDNCFAGELLKENIPEGCRLVYLCRPERIYLLNPPSRIIKLELKPFLQEETLENLRLHFPEATPEQSEEFHRLTSANPRVQANALDTGTAPVSALLVSLGPSVVTVEAQIRQQLENALEKLKSGLPGSFQGQVDKICLGLATLSPNIPIEILARASGVENSAVKSFVADIGRSLWLYDESVQFRDEPTETWFRETFSPQLTDFEHFLSTLEPLANESSYTARVLPQLYLQAEQYDKLIDIALSNQFLPENSPIEARTIRVYRLQFALKAALKIRNMKDAAMLALRAGEEVAGNQRQTGLLRSNLDLLALLQDKQKIQDLAMQRQLSGQWKGSENVYSAALLSQIEEFKGEARSFIRSADNWLDIYYNSPPDPTERESKVTLNDILEMAFAWLNLDGISACMNFLNCLRSKPFAASVFGRLVRRLADLHEFAKIDGLLKKCKTEPLMVIQLNYELFRIGRFCEKSAIVSVFEKLRTGKLKISKPEMHSGEKPRQSTLVLAESALYHGLPEDQILAFVKEYLPQTASRLLTHVLFPTERDYFLRSAALKNRLEKSGVIDPGKLLPKPKAKKKLSYDEQREVDEAKDLINGLLPWYIARIETIADKGMMEESRLNELAAKSNEATRGRYRPDDPLPETLAIVYLDILKFQSQMSPEFLELFYLQHLQKNKYISPVQWISAVRYSHRLEHLTRLRDEMENRAYQEIKARSTEGPDEQCAHFVNLARAVIRTSTDNAPVYFEDAITIASKFGEEMLHRWEAVYQVAGRAADLDQEQQELSYRFSRIAELVGQDTREKHWDREGALQIATRMSPSGGIAALSRWRDREIGRFGQMIYCLTEELVSSAGTDAISAWSFSEFCPAENLRYALRHFLKSKAIGKADKYLIAEDGIKRLRNELISKNYWNELSELLSSQGIEIPGLTKMLHDQSQTASGGETIALPEKAKAKKINWNQVFKGHQLNTAAGMTAAKTAFDKFPQSNKKTHLPHRAFWTIALGRIPDTELVPFLESMLECEWVEMYDFTFAFEQLGESRSSRPGFQHKLQSILESIGARYSLELVNSYSFDNMNKAVHGPDDKTKWLQNGLFAGLVSSQEFANEENLFDMVTHAAPGLSPLEAAETLSFAVGRFELHMEAELGDGPWLPWLETEANTEKALAAFLWNALGSPVSDTRWRAMHTLKKLAQFDRRTLIDLLFNISPAESAGSYGSNRYPFYNLHALLYLVIASLRITLERPDLLIGHKNFFLHYATASEHAIIQYYATQAAFSLEKEFPGTYRQSELDELRKVISPQVIAETEVPEAIPVDPVEVPFDIAAYEEEDEDEEAALDFHFGYDISRYWLGALGEVFGLNQKYIMDLAANVIVKEWNQPPGNFNDDARLELWNTGRTYYRVAHDHGSYPRDDNYIFYTSYHAMMTVAARLIKSVPLGSQDEDEQSPWTDWLEGHLTTRADGFWLSDWRDPLPIDRPDYANQDLLKWQTGTKGMDFLNSLLIKKGTQSWLTLDGRWHEILDAKKEVYHVSSALVSKETSASLMSALQTCSDRHNYKLPEFREKRQEISSPLFKLKGWIKDENLSPRLDEHDPFSEGLPIPPYYIDPELAEELDLVRSHDGKAYFKQNSLAMPVLLSEHWMDSRESKDDEHEQKGKRFSGSIELIKELCSKLDMDLILEVEIERNYYSKYGSGRDKDYKHPIHQIFILSADGTLKSTAGNHQIG